MKKVRKTVLRTALCALALFILVNICWYVWREVRYEPYAKGMEKNFYATWLVPRYVYTDDEGYDFSVKYPNYLSFTGNLCVGMPAEDDNPFTDFIVIWPNVTGASKYGASITVGNEMYQIYINPDGTAVDPADGETVAGCKENIAVLLKKANEMWDLE